MGMRRRSGAGKDLLHEDADQEQERQAEQRQDTQHLPGLPPRVIHPVLIKHWFVTDVPNGREQYTTLICITLYKSVPLIH